VSDQEFVTYGRFRLEIEKLYELVKNEHMRTRIFVTFVVALALLIVIITR
jgi:hypothetical protein